VNVARNDARHRFEATVEGYTAVLQYHEADGRVTLIHTEVPPELRGRRIADALARTITPASTTWRSAPSAPSSRRS
jgi:predicted GNAT family acetyltransferase